MGNATSKVTSRAVQPSQAEPIVAVANTAVPVTTKLTHATVGNCYLLELPTELRNEIYSLVLGLEGGFATDLVCPWKSHEHPLALTMTCKQIQQECGDMFFRLNEVRFEGPLLQMRDDSGEHETLKNIEAYFKALFRGPLASKLKYLHLSIGCLNVSEDLAERAWICVSNIIRGLDKNDLQLRLSFEGKGSIYWTVSYDFAFTDEKQTLKAMEECFKPQAVGHPWAPAMFQWNAWLQTMVSWMFARRGHPRNVDQG